MPQRRHSSRTAASSLEVLVAFTLLTCVLSLSVPLVVRHQRILSSQRDYRLALDELSNQLGRLSTLPPQEIPHALAILTPSPFVAERLPGAELMSELNEDDIGSRVTLRLNWQGPQRQAAPVSMTAWIMPDVALASADPPEGDTL